MTSISRTSLEDVALNTFHKRLAVYSSAAPFLDGYILSIIGVVMLQMTGALNLSIMEQGLIAAAPLVGMFFGGFLVGLLTDKIGRKLLYVLDLLAMVLFSLAQFWVEDAWWLIALRFLLGVAIGADHPLATSLLAEFLPKKQRGPILAALVMMWFIGAAAAYAVGEVILRIGGDDAWRWALASAAVPGAIFMLLRHGTPESARWLVSKGRIDEAEAVIKKVYGDGYSVDDLAEPETTTKVPISALFHSGYGKRIFFVSVFWTCSIIPQFAIYAFAPQILGLMGLEDELASVGSIVITSMFVIGCLLAVLTIAPLGRRKLLIHSFLWSGLALLLLGFFPDSSVVLTLILFSSYAVFIGGAQVLQYVYPNELFPTEIRGSAMGLCTSVSRIGAATGTYLVPLSLAAIGIGNTMLVCAGISLVGLIVAVLMAPETRSLELSQAGSLNSQAASLKS
ncbi:MFS transporter [Arthrobacter sp. USHLN218]|uniref:MFS transporter n=1 Tax=Arthrobacter sp. USHLN218 TaxID=3081232 RepID=UPI003015B352